MALLDEGGTARASNNDLLSVKPLCTTEWRDELWVSFPQVRASVVDSPCSGRGSETRNRVVSE